MNPPTTRGIDPRTLPLGSLAALFLDVGGTLVTLDFEWMAEELEGFGLRFTPRQIQRAEAAARPAVSEALARLDAENVPSAFTTYVSAILGQLARSKPRRFNEALAAFRGTGVEADGPGRRRVSDPASSPPPALPGPMMELIEAVTERLVAIFYSPAGGRLLWSRVVPGVHEALSRLKRAGVTLSAVSNSDGTVEELLADVGLRDHFDTVIDSEIVGHAKPDPRIFQIALDLLGVEPDRALHVGDMYFADIIGARRAGLQGVLVDPYGDWSDADCPRVSDVGELAGHILTARGRKGR